MTSDPSAATADARAVVGRDPTSGTGGVDPDALAPSGAELLVAAHVSTDAQVVVAHEPSGPVLRWGNAAASDLLRLSRAEVVGRPLLAVVPDPAAATYLLHPTRPALREVQVRAPDGDTSAVTVVAVPMAQDRWLLRLAAASCDEHEARVQVAEAGLRALVDRAPVGIGFSDGGLRLGYVNDHLARVLGAPVAELLGTGWLARVLPGDGDDLADDLLALLVDGEEVARLVRVHGTDGEAVVQVRATAVPQAAGGRGFLLTAEDVTEQQVRERRLAFEARHDALTGLGNRTALQERLAAVLADPRRRRSCAVAMLDLDGFKELNDRLGHDRGDQVLVAVATAVSRAVRDDDLVVRLGGDELVVVGEGVVDGRAAVADVAAEDGAPALEELAERLVRAVQDAASVAVPSARVTACLGLVAVGDRRDADVVLRDADLAMYAAKAAGAGRWVVRGPGAGPDEPRPSPSEPDA